MSVAKRTIKVMELDKNDVIVEGKDRFTILEIVPKIKHHAIHVTMRSAKSGAKSVGCYDLCSFVDVQDFRASDAVAVMVAAAEAEIEAIREVIADVVHDLGL